MDKYKKQLTKLKKDAEDAAGALLRDDKVSSLQRQITWFRKEAQKLDEITDKQKREVHKH